MEDNKIYFIIYFNPYHIYLDSLVDVILVNNYINAEISTW
jgi:hypothetical protein